MKKIIASTIAIAIAFTGCNGTKPVVDNFECKQDGVIAPQWTCISQTDNKSIVGLGSAPLSKAGQNFTRNNAIAAAHNDLAFQIETQVKAKVENFVRGTGVNDQEVVDSVSTQVSKQLANTTMNGSKQLATWSSDKTMFILVGLSNDIVNQEAKKQIINSSYKNDNALWQQFQSKQALDNLEKDFPTK